MADGGKSLDSQDHDGESATQASQSKNVWNIRDCEIGILNIFNEGRPSSSETNKEASDEASSEFLERCQKHFEKIMETGKDDCMIKSQAQPTIKILDMNDYDDRSDANKDNFFGLDIGEIDLKQIHDPVNGKTRHAMILGEAGAGKTTLSLKYCNEAKEGKIEAFKDFKLIYYVDAAHLQIDSKCTPFDLIFTQQMAGYPEIELTEEQQTAGSKWVEGNQEKILLIIDGLDLISGLRSPCGNNKKYDNLHFPVIANILYGKIWSRSTILTTSRWSVYWNLHRKPDKVIGLRGYNGTSMEIVARHYIKVTVQQNKFLEHITPSSDHVPNLHTLCQNPLFLKYAATTYEGKIFRESISELMSAIVLRFCDRPTVDYPKLDGVTKLAYYGMKENCFAFPDSYLEKLKIDVTKVKEFLRERRRVNLHQASFSTGYQVYMFVHQLMQEFCAALHIVNLEEHEVHRFVTEILERSNLEMTRLLCYGVFLNDNTTRLMKVHLENRKCSIAKCREILFDQLVALIPNGVISDIRMITLLHECGQETIEKIKPYIHSIHMDVFNLHNNDQIKLAKMIKQCSPLDEVYVREFLLNPTLLDTLADCYENVIVFQAGFEIKDSIAMTNVDDVMKLLDNTKLLFVMLQSEDEVKNEFLRRWLAKKTNFGCIGLINLNSIETFDLFRQLHEQNGFRELKLRLSDDFARVFLKSSFNQTHKKIRIIRINDRSLTEEKMVAYIEILELLGGMELAFYWCNLSAGQTGLSFATKVCKNRKIQLSRIRIFDRSISVEALPELASLMVVASCKSVHFMRCDLVKEKLDKFAECCKELDYLHLKCTKMAEEEYEAIARILNETSCREISFDNCGLNENKIVRLQAGCKAYQVKLKSIYIWDRLMEKEVYAAVASMYHQTFCENLYFGNCNLTKDNLTYFKNHCVDKGITILRLSIKDRFTMCEHQGENFTHLHGFKINDEGAPSLKVADEDPELQFKWQKIFERVTKREDVIIVLCELMRDVVEEIEIAGWIINEQQRWKMKKILFSSESKVKALKLPEEKWIHKIEESVPYEIVTATTGEMIDIGGCFVQFASGDSSQEAMVEARINPLKNDEETVSSTLRIAAKYLYGKVKVYLHVWCTDGRDYEQINVFRRLDRNDNWELFHTCSVGNSRFIELDVSHRCEIVATTRRNTLPHIIRLMVYHAENNFVVALIRDTPLSKRSLSKFVSDILGKNLQEDLGTLACSRPDQVQITIGCAPDDDFAFKPCNSFVFDINEVLRKSVACYRRCILTSQRSDRPITIIMKAEKNGAISMQNNFICQWRLETSSSLQSKHISVYPTEASTRRYIHRRFKSYSV